MLQEKLTDGKHQPVIVRMYEELQEKSTAMLVNVEPDPADKELEDVRVRLICIFFLKYYYIVYPIYNKILDFDWLCMCLFVM